MTTTLERVLGWFTKAETLQPLVELGSTGLKAMGGRVQEEWHRSLQGNKWAKVAQEMLCTAVPAAGVRTIQLLLQRAPERVVPAGDDDKSLRAAEFLTECMTDMRRTWPAFRREARSYLPFGWAVSEVTFKKRDGKASRYSDGLLGWADFSPRAQESIASPGWEITPTGEVLAFYQSAPMSSRTVRIPLDKCVHFSLDSTKGNPEGRSILRSAYVDWYHGKRVLQFEGVGVERDNCGTPRMQVPANVLADASLSATYEKMLGQWRRDELSYILVPSETNPDGSPSGYKCDLVGSPGSKQYDTDKILRRSDQRVALAIGTEVQMLGLEKVGSFALADSKTNLLGYAIAALLDFEIEVLNAQAVNRLMALNGFPQETWPHLEHGDVEGPDLAELGAAVQSFAGAGLLTPDLRTENRLREHLDLPLLEGE